MKHVAIMPLIGGLAIGAARALGRPPEAIIDLTDEKGNVFGGAHSSSLRKWWPHVPYAKMFMHDSEWHLDSLSDGAEMMTLPVNGDIDVTHSVPPCGGLSMANDAYVRGAAYKPEDSPINRWMFKTAELAMRVVKPRVHVMENAIAMGTPRGTKVVERLTVLANKYGYSVTVVKVDTANHGIPQRRRRTFTLFWRDGARAVDLTPFLRVPPPLKDYLGDRHDGTARPHAADYEPHETFERSAIMRWVVGNWGIGYRSLGRLHQRNSVLQMIIERKELEKFISDMNTISHYGTSKYGLEMARSAAFWNEIGLQVKAKVDMGKGFRRNNPVVLRDVTPTATEYALHWWLHPVEDRFLNVREVMDLMGLPNDFRLATGDGAEPQHIIQNVPTSTAEDMVRAVVTALGSGKPCDPMLTVQDFSRLGWLRK